MVQKEALSHACCGICPSFQRLLINSRQVKFSNQSFRMQAQSFCSEDWFVPETQVYVTFTKFSAKCLVVEIYHYLLGWLFWWNCLKRTKGVFLPFDVFWSFLLIFVPRELETHTYSSAWYVFAPLIDWAEPTSDTPERFVYMYGYIYIYIYCI